MYFIKRNLQKKITFIYLSLITYEWYIFHNDIKVVNIIEID